MDLPAQGLSIATFDCDMDDFALRSKWEKWKRSLKLYFEAASITDAVKKKALLLHNGEAVCKKYTSVYPK
nr:unnamed protein product [Callosobruchus chinensis]